MSDARPAVLYVDDEWTNRTVFEASYSDRFRIIVVGSGAEALEVMKKEVVACLVTDQRMPEMSGNELLERAKASHPNVIRVVVTAYSDHEPILKAVNDGLVARYVVKPYEADELGRILDWAVGAFSLGAHVQARLLAAERLISLGGMAGSVLHEIRNQIGYPKSNTAYLQDAAKHAGELAKLVEKHGKDLTPGAKASLADLAIELPQLADDSMEGIVRVEAILSSFRRVLKGEQSSATADPHEAISHTLTLLGTISKDVRTAYEGPEKPPRVAIDETELIQVLLNLGRNAIQAYPPAKAGRVVFSLAVVDRRVAFTVADDGPGMSAEVLAKVGTEYFTTKPEGTGLGIAQCRRAVAKAGGELSIESTVGKGTTIRFSLPVA